MPMSDLVLLPGRTNLSEATGTPDNGVNEFAHSWDLRPDQIVADQIELEYFPQGGGVTAASFVGLSTDKLSLRVNVTTDGVTQLRIRARHVHSENA